MLIKRLLQLKRILVRFWTSKSKGSISVFMVFILFIMIGAAGTLLEGGRYFAVKSFSKVALKQSMESLKTEYYRPLSEEYHLFYILSSVQGEQQNILLQEKLNSYLKYSLEPNDGIEDWNLHLSRLENNLVSPCLENMTINNIVTAVDSGVFELEAADYMKYENLDNIFGQYIDKFKFAKTLGSTTQVLSEKITAEESISQLSTGILHMMMELDGISVNDHGIQTENNGKVKTEENFAKKFVPENISQQSTAINNQLLWTSLKSKYINVDNLFNMIRKEIETIQSLREQISKLENELDTLIQSTEGEGCQEELLQDINNSISSLAEDENKENEQLKQNLLEITDSVQEVTNCVEKALDIIPEIKSNQKNAQNDIVKYRDILNRQKDNLDQDTYAGLNDDCESLENYIGLQNNSGSSVQNIIEMKPVLEANLEILEIFKQLKYYKNLEDLKSLIERCSQQLCNYNITKLKMDYSTLQLEKEVDNPLDHITKLAKESILELVIRNTKEISENTIQKADNLSTKYVGNIENKDCNIIEIIKSIAKEVVPDDFMESVNKESNSFDWTVLKRMAKIFLVNEYLYEHFHCYTSQERQEKQALDYEIEYILSGKDTDKSNLMCVINKLVLWRTILNFISIMGDQQKNRTAYATAAAIVGFTGMEPLIRLVKTFILIMWSFDESLLDAAILLEGKNITVLKNSNNFQVKFSDLFIISKEWICNKADQFKSQSGVSLNYEEYEKLFLLLGNQKRYSYRAMDLINENMQMRYDPVFNLENAIYAYEVTADFRAKYRFMFFTDKSIVSNKNNSFWEINISSFSSYS